MSYILRVEKNKPNNWLPYQYYNITVHYKYSTQLLVFAMAYMDYVCIIMGLTYKIQGIDALRCRQPERDAHETYADTL